MLEGVSVRFSGTESGQRGIEDVLRELRDELYAVDAADTVAVLDAAWRGFSAANVAGQLLADSDPAFAALSDTTQPVFAQAGQILRAAPSLPAVIDPVMLNVACPTGDRFQQRRAQVIREIIFDVILALNTLLAGAALHTRNQGDHAACREGTRLSNGLAELL
ncbi:MAG: hypothetical protein JWR24_2787 [Actinoallomurus sp.]|jgi:hypothetical protein|nr:hypothetical protein [Actinoallomurus sp.]